MPALLRREDLAGAEAGDAAHQPVDHTLRESGADRRVDRIAAGHVEAGPDLRRLGLGSDDDATLHWGTSAFGRPIMTGGGAPAQARGAGRASCRDLDVSPVAAP